MANQSTSLFEATRIKFSELYQDALKLITSAYGDVGQALTLSCNYKLIRKYNN